MDTALVRLEMPCANRVHTETDSRSISLFESKVKGTLCPKSRPHELRGRPAFLTAICRSLVVRMFVGG